MRSSFVSLALMLGITFAAPVTYTPPTNNDKAVTKIVDKILQMQSTHKVLFSGNEIKKNKDGSYKVRVVSDCLSSTNNPRYRSHIKHIPLSGFKTDSRSFSF